MQLLKYGVDITKMILHFIFDQAIDYIFRHIAHDFRNDFFREYRILNIPILSACLLKDSKNSLMIKRLYLNEIEIITCSMHERAWKFHQEYILFRRVKYHNQIRKKKIILKDENLLE